MNKELCNTKWHSPSFILLRTYWSSDSVNKIFAFWCHDRCELCHSDTALLNLYSAVLVIHYKKGKCTIKTRMTSTLLTDSKVSNCARLRLNLIIAAPWFLYLKILRIRTGGQRTYCQYGRQSGRRTWYDMIWYNRMRIRMRRECEH